MPVSDKNALGRVLMISKTVYSSVKNEIQPDNTVAALDLLSAALSHIGSADAPLRSLLGELKRGLRSSNREFYPNVKKFFKPLYPPFEFDMEKARKHVPAVIYGNDKICEKLVRGENDKAKSMCSAMASYPGFIFGEFEELSDEQFYDLVFGYYPKLYEEDFMEEMRGLFTEKAQ